MGRLFVNGELSGRRFVFRDRVHAGTVLAGMLGRWRGSDAVVLAIPAGGVPVGMSLAAELGLAFDPLFIRKLHFPHNPEAGFGAVGEHGEVLLNPRLAPLLDEATVQRVIELEKRALRQRITRLRALWPEREVKGRPAIITDDGLASGFTMLAAIAEARARGAASVIVAVPTASATAAATIAEEADELHVANLRSGPTFAVAEAYENWRDIPLEEVEALLTQDSAR